MILSLFSITVKACEFTMEQFKIHKLKVQALIIMVVKNKFIETICEIDNLIDTWKVLKNIFEVRNLSQILLLSTRLYNIE